MKYKLDSTAYIPLHAHKDDAGLDLRSPVDVCLRGRNAYHGGSVIIDTGFHAAIPKGCVGFIKSKSGLMCKHGIIAGEGTIDSGYTGSIAVALFNLSDDDYYFNRGDKIAQLVIVPCIAPELEEVDELDDSDRGDGGFGSTGR